MRWFIPTVAALVVSSSPAWAEAKTKITVTGSSTVAPLAGEIAKQYEKKNPTLRINVQAGGSSRGLADTRRGLADIGMVSRAIETPKKLGLKQFTIAKDGIAMIIHTDNPVNELTRSQIARIYKGKIDNWKAVGGKKAPITVVNKSEGRSTLKLFLDHFALKNPEVDASVIIGHNQQAIKTVAGNPSAIAYVSIGAAHYAAEDGVEIKLLPMNGVKPTLANVRNGSFPLTRKLNLITKGIPSGPAKAFISFARSKDANKTVEELSFVPIAP